MELANDAAPKFKIGDGVNVYKDLDYVTMTPAEISTAINTAVTNAKHTHSNKDILECYYGFIHKRIKSKL
ncbi:hypothetical protein [Eubacterium ramulus]|uniref:hypothetical protein n=1 Tax=Eubacterium ramulus TaxID=39490 RepID=UPI003999C3CF